MGAATAVKSETRDTGSTPPPRPQHCVRHAVVLFFFLFAVLVSNLRNVTPGDTWAVRYVPFGVLNQHSLSVDDYIQRFVQPYLEGKMHWGLYFAVESRGHWMSSYPILTPLLVTPLYAPAAWWVQHKHIDPASDAMVFVSLAMEKISAALIVALSGVLLFLALGRVVSPRASLLLALVYTLASPTWSVSAQALWLQDLNELALALLLWALLRDNGSRRAAFWIGLACALAVANKLTNALVFLPIIIWFCWRGWRQESSGQETATGMQRLTGFFAPLVALGTLVIVYNLYYFGSLFGAYESAFRNLGYAGIEAGFHGSWAEGIAGLLVSPNRGLFIFVPWTLLSIWGAVLMIRRDRTGWMPWLAGGALLHFLFYAKLERWYGGYTFGPRYLIDLLPLLAFCLVPYFQRPRGAGLNSILTLTFAFAFGVQVLGAFYYPNGDWNELPVSVDLARQRIWNWRDNQIMRTLHAGPAHTKIVDHLRGKHQQVP
jgi:hypothetical protein